MNQVGLVVVKDQQNELLHQQHPQLSIVNTADKPCVTRHPAKRQRNGAERADTRAQKCPPPPEIWVLHFFHAPNHCIANRKVRQAAAKHLYPQQRYQNEQSWIPRGSIMTVGSQTAGSPPPVGTQEEHTTESGGTIPHPIGTPVGTQEEHPTESGGTIPHSIGTPVGTQEEHPTESGGTIPHSIGTPVGTQEEHTTESGGTIPHSIGTLLAVRRGHHRK